MQPWLINRTWLVRRRREIREATRTNSFPHHARPQCRRPGGRSSSSPTSAATTTIPSTSPSSAPTRGAAADRQHRRGDRRRRGGDDGRQRRRGARRPCSTATPTWPSPPTGRGSSTEDELDLSTGSSRATAGQRVARRAGAGERAARAGLSPEQAAEVRSAPPPDVEALAAEPGRRGRLEPDASARRWSPTSCCS